MGSIHFDIAALAIQTLNLFLFYHRGRALFIHVKYFSILLWTCIAAVAFDTLSIFLFNIGPSIPITLNYLVSILYFIFQMSIPLSFIFFNASLTNATKRIKPITRRLMFVPWLIALCMILTTPFTGWIFSFTKDGIYIRGPGQPIFYAIIAVYLFIGLLSLTREKRKVPKHIKKANILFLPFSVIPVIIQFFFPTLLVQSLGVAFALLIILITVKDFKSMIEPSTGLLNKTGLLTQIELLMSRRARFTGYAVLLNSTRFLFYALGPDLFSQLEKELCERLLGKPNEKVFAGYIDHGTYLLIDSSRERGVHAMAHTNELLAKPFIVDQKPMIVQVHLCRIDIPEETVDQKTLLQVFYDLQARSTRYPVNTILRLKDIDFLFASREMAIKKAINRALSGGNLEVWLQPLIQVSSGKPVGAEALLRLNDEELGRISPVEFIPIAERDGSIRRLGNFVLEQTCRYLNELREFDFWNGYIEVNLSPVEGLQSDLTRRFTETIKRYGLTVESLVIEITETAAVRAPEILYKNIKELEQARFQIAIDDYGTGYSNMLSLINLPFSIIKIDRSLVVEADKSALAREALTEIIGSYLQMGCEVVAEGVETPEQLSMVQEAGATLIQGYIYSRPLPFTEFKAYLTEKKRIEENLHV